MQHGQFLSTSVPPNMVTSDTRACRLMCLLLSSTKNFANAFTSMSVSCFAPPMLNPSQLQFPKRLNTYKQVKFKFISLGPGALKTVHIQHLK